MQGYLWDLFNEIEEHANHYKISGGINKIINKNSVSFFNVSFRYYFPKHFTYIFEDLFNDLSKDFIVYIFRNEDKHIFIVRQHDWSEYIIIIYERVKKYQPYNVLDTIIEYNRVVQNA